MSKLDKKKLRLHDRILELEDMLRTSLHRKDSAQREINVPKITREIAELRAKIQGA